MRRETQLQELGDLRRALELAIRKEDYERAADLRDEVAAAESDLEPSGSSEDRGQDPA